MPTLIMAPIRGVTDAPFRQLFASHFQGIEFAVAPFIDLRRPVRERDIVGSVTSSSPGLRTVPQILGKEPNTAVETAQHLIRAGATEINLNLGCPVPMAVGRGHGAGLLESPETFRRILDALSPLKLALSVKVRLGVSSDILGPVIEVANDFPLRSLTIHARTAKQLYSGSASLDAFAAHAATSKNPVFYNGDIGMGVRIEQVLASAPATMGFMLGRGLLADPLLAERIQGVAATQPEIARIQAFHDAVLDSLQARLEATKHVLDRMRGFWDYLALSFSPQGQRFIKKALKATAMVNYRERLAKVWHPEFWTPQTLR